MPYFDLIGRGNTTFTFNLDEITDESSEIVENLGSLIVPEEEFKVEVLNDSEALFLSIEERAEGNYNLIVNTA